MVSNARDDLPDPDKPVMTTRLSRGMSTSIFFRLCSRAPRTRMNCMGLGREGDGMTIASGGRTAPPQVGGGDRAEGDRRSLDRRFVRIRQQSYQLPRGG